MTKRITIKDLSQSINNLTTTIEDLAIMTKNGFDSIEERMATKDDLKAFATKEDLKTLVNKEDLEQTKRELKQTIHEEVDRLDQRIDQRALQSSIKNG